MFTNQAANSVLDHVPKVWVAVNNNTVPAVDWNFLELGQGKQSHNLGPAHRARYSRAKQHIAQLRTDTLRL